MACPDHGLEIGADVDNVVLQHLAQGELADFIWEAPADFTSEHGQLSLTAIRAHQDGDPEAGEKLWKQVQAIWSRAWSANYQALGLLQTAGLTRFSPVKPQRWVVASFEHHCGTHGLPHPHIHNIVIPALTRLWASDVPEGYGARHEHLHVADGEPGRDGAVPRASDTIVMACLGEADTVAKGRSTMATFSDCEKR